MPGLVKRHRGVGDDDEEGLKIELSVQNVHTLNTQVDEDRGRKDGEKI